MLTPNRRVSVDRKGKAAIALTGLIAGTLATLPAPDAKACGCFAPPDPTVPILQAGERIVFSHNNGVVTAIIQIQYQGDAKDFGWLLPLPSVPTMTLGVDEVFTQVLGVTQPKYRLTKVAGDSCAWTRRSGGSGFASPAASAPSQNAAGGADDGSKDSSPLVYESSIGPYDYAVLKADNKDEMFQWLTNNHYFIPTGTDEGVKPYIHPGAFFLALKLQSGQSSGDLQPVVIQYQSDLPMIPIILTSVAANPNMGVQVFMLGAGRAIPRNYRHTILNEEHIDWFNAGKNYGDVVTAAVKEADGHHSFITEYAGTSDIMKNVLVPAGRFGDRMVFEGTTNAIQYVQLLRQHGFTTLGVPNAGGPIGGVAPGRFFGGAFSSTLVAILAKYFPKPAQWAGVPDAQYYNQLDSYLSQSHSTPTYDAAALTKDIWDRIVTPTQNANDMFASFPKLTRLYTTLSPEDMNLDPVFSFNPDLPDVSQIHEATLTYICDFFQDGPNNTPGILKLPFDGREFYVKNQADWEGRNLTKVPYSQRIEFLREEGAPKVEIDNSNRISHGDASSCTCVTTGELAGGMGGAVLVMGLFLGAVLTRRNKREE